MRHWIASSNPQVYDSIEAFKKYSVIDWGNRGNNKINVGDIVYIYITKPIQKIAIKTEVIKTNFSSTELLDSEDFLDREEKNIPCDNFIRLKFLHFINNNYLTLSSLQRIGLKGNIQGKRKIEEPVLSYILEYEKLNIFEYEDISSNFNLALKESKGLTSKDRKKRISKKNKLPEEIKIISKGYRRNPDVVIETLLRANGICEYCNNKAPFIRASDNSPYLEVHHKKLLSEGGEDTLENTIAVCPNCHRFLHYGKIT